MSDNVVAQMAVDAGGGPPPLFVMISMGVVCVEIRLQEG